MNYPYATARGAKHDSKFPRHPQAARPTRKTCQLEPKGTSKGIAMRRALRVPKLEELDTSLATCSPPPSPRPSTRTS
jgi:hypothetical protein